MKRMEVLLYVIILGLVVNLIANMIWKYIPSTDKYIDKIVSAVLICICILLLIFVRQNGVGESHDKKRTAQSGDSVVTNRGVQVGKVETSSGNVSIENVQGDKIILNENNTTATVDPSLVELQRILQHRAIKVEEWLREQQKDNRSTSSLRQYDEAIQAFRRLHKQHIDALKEKQFVLAHETLREIHVLLGKYDAAMYARAPEYGYKYPGNLDSDDMYSVLKSADTSIKSQLVKSLFVGMISREHAVIQGNSNFQFNLSLNTGISLVRAVSEHDLGMAKALLDAGFNVNIRVTSKLQGLEGEDYTPLMIAAHNGNKEIVEELLRRGADANAINWNGETAADIARKIGNNDIVSLLRINKDK